MLALALPIQAAPVAAAEPDPSDIVLVLDFSGSILDDEAIRNDFAGALEGIAARAEATSDKLVAGDATVSIVRFATRAADVPECTGIELRNSKAGVTNLANCLRRVADAYRKGADPAVTRAIGDDTNYVAAMEQAAKHLPENAPRPAIIFFTDGKHETPGVPVSEVVPARDRLFGDRSPFALLPVGMGVDPQDRPRLEAGLIDLRITRDMERCEGGPFEWPNVVFETAEAAGQAVAVALQDVSCTFTVEPSPTPSPSPTPEPVATPTPTPSPTPVASVPPGLVRDVGLAPRDAAIEVTWRAPADADEKPVEDYLARCRPTAGGDWIESTEGTSTDTSTTIDGLTNGVEYTCEVAAVRASGPGGWLKAVGVTTPFGAPPAPAKPTVEVLDGGARIRVSMPAGAPVSGFRYDCSDDGGSSWPAEHSVDGNQPVADIAGLTNGRDYVCRAFATNDSGISDASPVSDVFRPCGGFTDCNPIALPLIGGVLALLALVIVVAILRLRAGRKVWVTAQVDRGFPITLGRGPTVGMSFITNGAIGEATPVVKDDGRKADVRIHFTGGVNFDVKASRSRVKATAGRSVQITDPEGLPHTLVLGAFDQPPGGLRPADDGDRAKSRPRRLLRR